MRLRTPLERTWWELSFGTKQRSVCLIVKELRPFPPGEFLKFVLHSDPHKKTQDRTTAQCWKHVFFAAYNPSFFRKFLTPLENFLTPHDALGLKGLRSSIVQLDQLDSEAFQEMMNQDFSRLMVALKAEKRLNKLPIFSAGRCHSWNTYRKY